MEKTSSRIDGIEKFGQLNRLQRGSIIEHRRYTANGLIENLRQQLEPRTIRLDLNYFLWVVPALLVLATAYLLAVNGQETWAYFSGVEEAGFSITTGVWDDGQGTSIQVHRRVLSYEEPQPGAQHVRVWFETCAKNTGEQPTNQLKLDDIIQINENNTQFQELLTQPVDLSEHPLLQPDEEHCYEYPVDVPYRAGAVYRSVAWMTITNHSGWLPGSHHCPRTDACAFGPEEKLSFELPDDLAMDLFVPLTGENMLQPASVEASVDSRLIMGSDQARVSGQVCVTNSGAGATRDLEVMLQLFEISNGQLRPMDGRYSQIRPEEPLPPGESRCYDHVIDINANPQSSYMAVTWVAISNFSDWLPGDANCPGEAMCLHGVEVRLMLPVEIEDVSEVEPSSTPTVTATPVVSPTETLLPTNTIQPQAGAQITPTLTPTVQATASNTPKDAQTQAPTQTLPASTATVTPTVKPDAAGGIQPSPTPQPDPTATIKPVEEPGSEVAPTQTIIPTVKAETQTPTP
jgi:hypothetical protein